MGDKENPQNRTASPSGSIVRTSHSHKVFPIPHVSETLSGSSTFFSDAAGSVEGLSIRPPTPPPPRRKKQSIFGCFGGGSNADHHAQPARQEPPKKHAQKPKPILMYTNNQRIDLSALRRLQPDVYQEFYDYLVSQYCIENLLCWEGFQSLLQLHIIDELTAGLTNLYNTFFTAESPSQIGCSEIYSPMQQLCDDKHKLSLDELKQAITVMCIDFECHNLDYYASVWALHRESDDVSSPSSSNSC